MPNKKLLTLDDLYNFCVNQNKMYSFNSKDSGYQIVVRTLAQFEVNTDIEDNTLLFCNVKLMHSGENNNHSNVTDEALIKASKHLAYKPILANFIEYVDEETGETLKDFTSHDMELNEDGSTTYFEKQVGCFTSDDPYFEIEEDTGHNFLYGVCAIPREYTDASSIIERKNGTKISVELAVNSMEYDAVKHVLNLTDIVILGATLLGKNQYTLEDVKEGMQNARLDIADFSTKNNSIQFNKDLKMIELLESIDKKLSDFNKEQIFVDERTKEGGSDKNMFEKLLEKYGKTVEDIHFEYKNLSDEELEVKFEEEFSDDNVDDSDDTDDTVDNNTPEPKDSNDDGENDDDDDDNPVVKDDNACGGGAGSKAKKKRKKNNSIEYSYEINGQTKTFEISLQDKIYAIHDLVNSTYADADNTYYGTTVYETYVIMHDCCYGKYFKQSYTSKDDVYSLVGDRVEVFAEFVTEEEKSQLESMRANYAELKEFKETTEKNQLHAQREEIINSETFAVISKKNENGEYVNKAFSKLVDEMDNYSLDDLEKEAKVILADYVTANKTFSFDLNNKPSVTKKIFSNPDRKDTKQSRYGNLFKK